MSIALPVELARFVDGQVQRGHFASRSEVIRTALRAWPEWQAWVGDGPVAETPSEPSAAAPRRDAAAGELPALPGPLAARRQELLAIAAEEGLRDVRLVYTTPAPAAVEAGAPLKYVELLVKLAPGHGPEHLGRATVRMGRALGCMVWPMVKPVVATDDEQARRLREARPL